MILKKICIENIKTVASQHANYVGCFNIFTKINEKKNFAKTGIKIIIKIIKLLYIYI